MEIIDIPDQPPLERVIMVPCPGCMRPLKDGTVRHLKACTGAVERTLYSYDGVTWALNGARLKDRLEQTVKFKVRVGHKTFAEAVDELEANLHKPEDGVTGLGIPIEYVGRNQPHSERPSRRRTPRERDVKLRRPVHEHVCLDCSRKRGKEVRWVCGCERPFLRREHIPCPTKELKLNCKIG